MKLDKKCIRKHIRDFTIIIGVTFGLLIVLEALLRVVFSSKVEPFNFDPQESAYIFDSNCLVTIKPNIEKTFKRTEENGGERIIWKSNSNGFRGKELRDNPDTRIIVYGDSNIQGRFTKRENLFTSRLEMLLTDSTDKTIEVINAGVIGFGPDQSLIRFRKEADIFKPDIVIFHVFADNDFGDIIRNRLFDVNSVGILQKTFFKRKIDPLLKKNYLSFIFGEIWKKVMIFKCCRGVRKIIAGDKKKLSGENLIEEGLILREKEYSVYNNSDENRFSVFADSYDFDLALIPQKESSQTKIKLMTGVLNAAKIFATQKGIKFLVLIQPSPFDLNEEYSPNYIDAGRYTGYTKGNLVDFIDKICDKNGIQRLNLYHIFQEHGQEDLFFKGDNHWNDTGQLLAAEVAAKFIQREFVLKQ